jgi:hypothetical protein
MDGADAKDIMQAFTEEGQYKYPGCIRMKHLQQLIIGMTERWKSIIDTYL